MRTSPALVPVELLPSRTCVAGAILALHMVAAYVLISGLIPQARPPAEPRTLAHVIIESRPARQDPVVAPQVRLHQPRIDRSPRPEPPVTPLPAAVPDTSLLADPLAPPAVTSVVAPAEIRVIGQNHLPDTEEYYPPAKRRDAVEGAADVRVCVDGQGVRQGEPVLEHSSGDTDLDRGALNVARHGRYARAVQGGEPVPHCYRFRITFRIR